MQKEKKPNQLHLKSAATRRAILAAAQEVFARDGYERAQIEEIASMSGRTRGAIYGQFKTKEQLFFAVQEQRLQAAQDRVKEILSRHQPGSLDMLKALKTYYASLDDADATILDLELQLHAIRNPDSDKEWSKHYLALFHPEQFSEAFSVYDEPGRSRIKNRELALASLKSALSIMRRFLPQHLSPNETTLLLREVFEGLFPSSRE
jgi:AcrR family transcriptional regulator